jgi:hypothetical protein
MRKIEDREEGGLGGGVYAKVTEYVRKQSPVKVIGVLNRGTQVRQFGLISSLSGVQQQQDWWG